MTITTNNFLNIKTEPKLKVEYTNEYTMINIEGVFNNEERQNYSTIDPKTEDFFADRPVIENYKDFYGLRSINFLVDYLIITDDNTIRFYLNKNIDTLSKLIKTEYAFTDTLTNKIFAEFNDSKFASSRNKHGVTISYKFPAEIYNNVDRLYLKMKIKIYNTDTLYSEAKRIVDWYENPYHKTLENIGFFSHSQTKTSTSLSKCVVDIDTTLPIEHIQNCYSEIIGDKYAYTDSKSYIYEDTGIFFVNVEPLLMFINCNVFVRYRIYFLSPEESDYKVTHKKFLHNNQNISNGIIGLFYVVLEDGTYKNTIFRVNQDNDFITDPLEISKRVIRIGLDFTFKEDRDKFKEV